MALYICKLGSSDGRIIEKEFEAGNPRVLRQSLEEQGFYVFDVRKRYLQFLWDKGLLYRRVQTKELLTFNQELLVLIRAGLPIIQALDTTLERVDKGEFAEILTGIREDVKGGAALSDAFEKYPHAFSHLYVASLRAGERTGDLPLTIRRYVTYLKRVEEFRKKTLAALYYPAILLSVAFAAVTLLLVYVVPTFSHIYADAGSQLPVPTQILITFTSIMRKYFLVFVVVVIVALTFFRRWSATGVGRFTVDGLKLRMPFMGKFYSQYALAGFMRTFATVLGSGIPIVESLKMSVGTLNNRVMELKFLTAVTKVEEGVRLSTALEGSRFMSPLALRMLGVGETTGSLEEMLGNISDHLEAEIDQKLHIITTSIEPAIMIVMGVVIGVIIITMYLPVFKIAGTVG